MPEDIRNSIRDTIREVARNRIRIEAQAEITGGIKEAPSWWEQQKAKLGRTFAAKEPEMSWQEMTSPEALIAKGKSVPGATIASTLADVVAGAHSYLDPLAFGLPSYLESRLGIPTPEAQTTAGKLASGVGGLAGFVKGPAKAGTGLAQRIPGISRAFAPTTVGGKLGKAITLAKRPIAGAASLGAAGAMMTPETGFLDVGARAEEAGEMAKTGALFGTLEVLPTRPARMLAMAATTGIPSTMQNAPIEDQVFQYGLGAYFGYKSPGPRKLLAMNDKVRAGFLDQADKLIDAEESYVKSLPKESVFENLDVMLRRGGKQSYTPAYKEWRPKTQKKVWDTVKKIRKRHDWHLRGDEIGKMLRAIQTKHKSLRKGITRLSDTELYNLNAILEEGIPPVTERAFQPGAEVPVRGGYEGKKITPYDYIRPGLWRLKKIGFGDPIIENHLSNMFFEDGVTRAQFLNNYIGTTNNMKAAVPSILRAKGLKGRVARANFALDMGDHLNGGISSKKIGKLYGKDGVRMAKQARRMLDLYIEHQNRIRAEYGEKPIEYRKNYLHHAFNETAQFLQKQGFDTSEFMADIANTTPGKFVPRHARQRKGKAGYTLDMWKAMDAYANATSRTIADSGLRKAKDITSTLISGEGRKAGLTRYGKRLANRGIDVTGIVKNLKSYVRMQTSKGLWDKSIENMAEPWNKTVGKIVPPLQIRSMQQVANSLTSLMYGNMLAYRPAPAIRNLSQQMMIIGRTGFKPLLKAYNTKTADVEGLLSESKMLTSREHAYKEEAGVLRGNVVGKLVRPGMRMFKGADWYNVRNAYLAGYYEAIGKGKTHAQAVKAGDQTAAITQYIYLPENRGGISNFFGLSATVGRPASLFTTWPTGYVEFLLQSSKPEHRKNLYKYAATVAGAHLGLSAMGVKAENYTQFKALFDLLRMPTEGLPIQRIMRKPQGPLFIDGMRGMVEDEDDLMELLLYMEKTEG